jgi:lipopolysaccharide biosynthesis glycosyltransferase
MVSMRDKIHIVFSPDENYAVHAGVAVMSILQHASKPGRFHFYFLQGDRKLSDRSRAKFDEIIRANGAALDYVEVDVRPLAGFANMIPNHVTSATFYRMMIPDLLPQLERCLYLDCDVLALGDLAQLWDEANSDTSLGAVADCFVERGESKKYEFIRRYFNSGVLLMNLRRWRERERVKACLQLSADPKMHERFADQDVFNVVFCDDVHFLHPRWNIQTGQKPLARTKELDQEWREILQAPRLAHFTSPSKPGNLGMTHSWSLEYWRMLAKTPWGREMPDFSKKILMARLYRLKCVISKTLRSILDVRMNLKARRCRLILFGRILVDRKSRKQPQEIQA